MTAVSLKSLYEAGVHFGHKTARWHPKMKPYIYGARSGIYIIDIRQTLESMKKTYDHVRDISSTGGKILFVGTKFQAKDAMAEEAIRSNNYFVNFRWLGGMMTNFSTIKQSIAKLKKLEEQAGPEFNYPGIIKKEGVQLEKSRKKLEAVLGGIREMRKKPAAIFVVDINREDIAIKEAQKLGIPVIAVVDTNCDPRHVDFLIPGNDDSVHCIQLYSKIIASASLEGQKIYESKVREQQAESDELLATAKQAEAKKNKVPATKLESEEKKDQKAKVKTDKPANKAKEDTKQAEAKGTESPKADEKPKDVLKEKEDKPAQPQVAEATKVETAKTDPPKAETVIAEDEKAPAEKTES